MKRAGISLALVVMLLLGAAAPVQAQAEETGLAAEAESFYRSVLAAKDRETLQTYLDCFSDQRRVELRAELPATLRQGLDTVLQQMKLPSITPVEENTQQKETGWQLDASTTWDDAAGSYTLRLETSSEAGGADAVIRYTLASELDAGSARLQYWAVDKTPQGWSQTMQNCPKVAAALDNGVLTVSGFDFTTGKKLVVQLAGCSQRAAAALAGRAFRWGKEGFCKPYMKPIIWCDTRRLGWTCPLNAPCFPVDQTIQDGQAVNFGYMLRPPHGDSSALPDGTNNAWCNAAYTVTDANGQVMGCFRVGAGQPVGAGRWDAPLPQICPQSDTQYTVTLTLTAVQDAAGSGPSGTAQAACSSTAPGICAAVIICNRQKPARQSKLLCGLCAVLRGKLWSGSVFAGKNMLQ